MNDMCSLRICSCGAEFLEETAREDACKIEHHLSDETFECLKKHLANI